MLKHNLRLLLRPLALAAGIILTAAGLAAGADSAALPWHAPQRFRVLLKVDPQGRTRSNSPASVDIDFQKALAEQGIRTPFDKNTVEVVAYDDGRGGQSPFSSAASFDGIGRQATKKGTVPGLVPWRIDEYFGITQVTLHLVMPDHTWTRYAVYFDTADSGLGKPRRYPGVVGDGDRFCEDFSRRPINASHFDQFCDFDGDGDLDLFKGGVEPYVYCYENVGANRMVYRGRLTSGGRLFTLPRNPRTNRSWVTVAFYDWDGDGQQDFFPSFGDGPDAGKIVFYRNTTRQHGGVLTFTRVEPLATVSGVAVAGGPQAGGWFPSIAFVKDWDGDGDGRTDILVGSNHHCYLYRNLGGETDGLPRLADAMPIQAGAKDMVLANPRFECADIDGDGLVDLLAGTQPGPVWWFKNVGSRKRPVFDRGTVVAFGGKYLIGDAHSGVKAADFDDDGLVDLVVGRFWERTELTEPDGPRDFGGHYKNVGTRTSPKFERLTAGWPFTEQFQICDAVRQNCVRAVDWDGDGKTDLLAGDTDGFIWLFRNQTGSRFPVFAPGEKLRADGGPLSGRSTTTPLSRPGRGAQGEGTLPPEQEVVSGQPLSVAATGGHARFDVCDWNNDKKPDLLVADGHGTVTLFLNQGSGMLGRGQRVTAAGKPIQGSGRSSVLVCDWDGDGRKDVVLAGEKGYHFYRNVGSPAQPVLEAPRPILFNGRNVSYARPNLGSFVDWDGDGKRDLIGCEFENSVRLYRNLGSGRPGEEPRFGPPEGEIILQASAPQMISGADAIDWDGDGRLDLLTGQGHGGSGLRFYRRDYLEDEVTGRHPLVSVIAVEQRDPRAN
jgi:hypothetical protein